MTSHTPIDRIVVGIDGSATSRRAFKWATALAAAEGAEVVAVMAWSYPPGLMIPSFGAPIAPTLPADAMADGAATRLRTFLDANPVAEDVVVKHQAIMGSARSVLTDLSGEADLVVLGRTGTKRVTRALLGSTASHCVRQCECPVVIVGDSEAPERTITVAVDGSASSIEALTWALGRSPSVGGEAHEVLAVYSHDEWELDELPLDDEFRQSLDEAAVAMLDETVAQATARTGDPDHRVVRQIREGDPRTTIIEQGDPSALLVLGAQGHSGLARWALGSLADYAVHHAPGTVIIWH